MDSPVTEGEQMLKQEFFMFLTANIISNIGGLSDFCMNQFIAMQTGLKQDELQ